MLNWLARNRVMRVLIPGASLLVLGGCPLTDAQITSILQSAIGTGLNTIVRQVFEGVLAGATV
jgi:hypothetical protein